MALTEAVIQARMAGFALLAGDGIEIGALHQPAPLPSAARVTYVDALSREEALRLFPEVDSASMVNPSVLADLDRDGLAAFSDGALDFVVASHVLEHLANPLFAVAEVFRVLRPGGRAALGIPDKRFTYDRPRAITPFLHVWTDFLERRRESDDSHYVDLLHAIAPGSVALSPEEMRPHLDGVRARREHVHVWDSDTFEETLCLTFALTGIKARRLHRSVGDENGFEYFCVWEKRPGP